MKDAATLKRMFDAASNEPEAEVWQLHDLVRAMWKHLTPEQVEAVFYDFMGKPLETNEEG